MTLSALMSCPLTVTSSSSSSCSSSPSTLTAAVFVPVTPTTSRVASSPLIVTVVDSPVDADTVSDDPYSTSSVLSAVSSTLLSSAMVYVVPKSSMSSPATSSLVMSMPSSKFACRLNR